MAGRPRSDAALGPGGGLSAAAFSALGYFVLMPNPRGSFGQGEEFTQANRKDFGYGDLRDILAGVDAVEAAYPVDPNRVGLTGWSYGGFMTMFAVTQTSDSRPPWPARASPTGRATTARTPSTSG